MQPKVPCATCERSSGRLSHVFLFGDRPSVGGPRLAPQIRSRPRRLGCTWELPSAPLSPIQALLRGPRQQTPPPSVIHHPSGWPTLSSVRLSDGSLLARCSSWFHTASFTCGRSSRHCYWRRSRLARSLAAGAFDGGRIVGSQQLENPAGQPQSWKPATRNYTSVEKSCTECSQAILQEDTNTNNSKRHETPNHFKLQRPDPNFHIF